MFQINLYSFIMSLIYGATHLAMFLLVFWLGDWQPSDLLMGFFLANIVTLFAYWLLRENLFHPQIQLNKNLAKANIQLAQAIQAEQSTKRELHGFLHSSPDMIWSIDSDYSFQMINVPAQTFLQNIYRITAAPHYSFIDQITPIQRQEWQHLYSQAFTGKQFITERLYQSPDGQQTTYVEFMFNPVIGPNGDVTSVSIVGRDISQRKEDAYQSYLHALTFDNISESLILLDINNLVTDCNQATLDLLGYTKQEIAELYLSFFTETVRGQELRYEIPRILKSKGRWRGEIEVKRKDGRNAIFDSTALPLINEMEDQIGTVILSIDITQSQTRHQQLQEAKLSAELASRAKSDFLARISHEFRTPLNAIIGYSELLQHDLELQLSEHASHDLNRVAIAGRTLLKLVDNLLDLSSIDMDKSNLNLELIDLTQLIDQVVCEVAQGLEENSNKLMLDCAEAPPIIYTDRAKLRKTLSYLLDNATKFTRHGEVCFTIHRETLDSITFEIADTGPGIPADKLNQIFDPFMQADTSLAREYGGLGSGLALCRHFVHLLDGKIHVSSNIGSGTTFRIRLPLLSLAQHAPPAHTQNAASLALST